MFGDFIWWQGVVEDRRDPLKLGRCRVRILGYHTDSKGDGHGIPTEHLPWATPSQPITSAAMNGIGTTPLGAVEGTWVFGFFRDGKNAQEPVMTGTFGGIPESPPDASMGFNDPNGKYPLSTHIGVKDETTGKYSGESDTNRLARGVGSLPVPTKGSLDPKKGGEDSPSLDLKRRTRTKGVPTALAGDMSNTITNSDNTSLYSATPWNEPNPRYGGTADSNTEYLSSVKQSSTYPLNHVRMSESGHVEEWDDTQTAERLHRFHKTGTFEEIQPDGTKVVKVVGSDYEIIAKDKDVQIRGSCNITIEGDCRMLYQGDLVQEVYGDYHLNVQGDMRTKITGNHATEVLADRKTVVNGYDDLFVGKDSILNVGTDRLINISGEQSETVKKDITNMYLKDYITATTGKTVMFGVGDIGISTTQNLQLSSVGNYDRTTIGASTDTITGISTVTNLGIKLETTTGLKTEKNLGANTINTTGLNLTTASIYKVTAGQILLN